MYICETKQSGIEFVYIKKILAQHWQLLEATSDWFSFGVVPIKPFIRSHLFPLSERIFIQSIVLPFTL